MQSKTVAFKNCQFSPEDVVAELAGPPGREALAVDLHESVRVQLPVRAILDP